VNSRHSTKRGRGRGGGRGKWKTSRLRQVGDGEDFMEGWQGSKTECFKCGGKGHWAKDCTAEADDAAAVASSGDEGDAAPGGSAPASAPLHSQAGALSVEAAVCEQPSEEYAAVAADPTPEALAGVLSERFGFSSFRGLQVDTIQRVLRGESCLSIMPTGGERRRPTAAHLAPCNRHPSSPHRLRLLPCVPGMGKSLCYQLPALLLPGLTLVVSPLIALMHDQCKAAPPALRPALLWSGQAPAQARQVLADVAAGAVRLLFVSPERLGNPHLLAALRPCMPLALVVVDEAHCVAEWGHSFRPAYFRLGGALQRDMAARCVLALTATATRSTEAAVCCVLGIPPAAVVRDAAVRQNLRLSAVRKGPAGGGGQRGNWGHIVQLFKGGGPLASARSAIVYCAWKGDADVIAKQLDVAGLRAKPYHAGLDYCQRTATEEAFAQGQLRVVVATVAFGMGIDISSVQAVVHSAVPRSLEEYVQQVGRAGRDGREALCCAFLNDDDFFSLRSLAYSGVVELSGVRAVLEALFSPTGAAQGAAPRRKAAGKKRKAADGEDDEEEGEEAAAAAGVQYGVLPSRRVSTEVDMSEDSIEAVLSYLEADDPCYVRILPKTAVSAKVSFYAAAPEALAAEHPVVAAVVACCPHPRNGVYSISTARLAAAARKAPGLALQDLQRMAQLKLIGFELSSEQGPAYRVVTPPGDLDLLAGTVHRRLTAMLCCQVQRLDTSYRAFAGAAAETQPAAQEAVLRAAIEQYFDGQDDTPAVDSAAEEGHFGACVSVQGLPLRPANQELLHAARAVLRRNQEQAGGELTACMLARILHGTGSPALPRDQWSKRMGAFWGSHKTTDFASVLNAARIACRPMAGCA
jgi:ATP-dependent DNA helicase Q4